MSFVATANCPACPWKLRRRIETHGTVRQQIDIANAVVDPMLIVHLDRHQTIKQMLIEAGEAPVVPGMSAGNGLRGLFDLEYKEVKD